MCPSCGREHASKTPSSVAEFTAQVNEVATRLLNGEMDLELARAYSSLVRTVAQSLSTEVAAARLEKRRPNLDLRGTDGK